MATKIIAPSGGHFTSLAAWFSSLPSILTEPEYAELRHFPGGYTSGGVAMIGKTATSVNRIKVYTHPDDRHQGVFDTNKFYMAVNARPIDIRMRYVDIEGLQILDSVPTTGIQGILATSSAGFSNISHNIINCNGKQFGVGIAYGANDANIYRNIMYNSLNTNNAMLAVAARCNVFNNTVSDCTVGVTTSSDTSFARNNVVVNVLNNNEYFKGTWNAGSGNNAVDHDGVLFPPPGTNNQVSIVPANEFVDPDNFDFRLKGDLVKLRENGADLGAPYNIGVRGNDIYLLWDIGADEFQIHNPDKLYFRLPITQKGDLQAALNQRKDMTLKVTKKVMTALKITQKVNNKVVL